MKYIYTLKNKKAILIIAAVVLITIVTSSYFTLRSPWKFREDRPIKVFILNSFHEDFPANLVSGYINGITEILEKENVDFILKIYDMDILRKDKNTQQEAAKEAKNLINEFNPDLIFATDEKAQTFVIVPNYLNTDVPIVYLSLSEDPANYGYVSARNVAGVIENDHFQDAVDYLKSLVPSVKKIAVVGTSKWESIVRDLEEQQNEIKSVEFVGWHTTSHFSELKELVIEYQDKTDAFLFTPLDFLLDEEGNEVSIKVTTRWVSENSNVPDVSLWPTPPLGSFSAVTYSPYEQGKEAGKIAYQILIKGKKPSSFEIRTTEIGDHYINLARAQTLGFRQDEIPSVILINSIIIETFPWDR